jgi:ABC-type phosphate/phosphonate transport system substrate-binding protein
MQFFYRRHKFHITGFLNSTSLINLFLRCFYLLILTIFIGSPGNRAEEDQERINVGFSSAFFYEVSRNDAIAAIRAWTQALLKKQDISAVPMPILFENIDEIKEGLSKDKLDYIAITTQEYAEVRDLLTCDIVTVSVTSNSINEEYLLLVSINSGKDNLLDLKGKKLLMVNSSRLSLAMVWLDTILLTKGMEPADKYFGVIDSEKSAGKVILPVFFNQADACVVTRTMYNTMVELNPQIAQRLKAIEVSPPLIPSFFCFTKNSDVNVREKVLKEISRWHLSSFGKQSLILFQTEGLETHPISCLDNTLKLVDIHNKLLKNLSNVIKDHKDKVNPDKIKHLAEKK